MAARVAVTIVKEEKREKEFWTKTKILFLPHEPQFELVCQKCGVRKSSVKRLSYL